MHECGLHMTRLDAYATEGQRGPDTIRQMARQQWGRDISEVEAQSMYDVKTRLFHSMPEAPVMPGVKSLMQQIKQQGMTIGVVTGSGQRPLIERLKRDFGPLIDNITTAYDVPRGKPFPDPYLIGLEKAGNLKPSDAVVIENAPLGVKAGVAARIFTIAVNTGPLDDEVLRQAGADIVMPDMPTLSSKWTEIITLLPSQGPRADCRQTPVS